MNQLLKQWLIAALVENGNANCIVNKTWTICLPLFIPKNVQGKTAPSKILPRNYLKWGMKANTGIFEPDQKLKIRIKSELWRIITVLLFTHISHVNKNSFDGTFFLWRNLVC